MPDKKFLNCLQVFPIGELNSVLHVSLKNRYVFIEMPKVASSTIKLRLMAHEIIGLDQKISNPHPPALSSPFVKPYQLDRRHLQEIMEDPSFIKFCFVRNPFSRVLSAYLDKIQRSESEKRQILRALDRNVDDIEQEVSFFDFLEALQKIPPARMDKHWRPQYVQSFSPYLNHSFIGKFENIENDLRRLSQMVDLDLITTQTVHDAHKTGSAEKIGEFYDSRCAELLTSIFAKDFKSFGYSTKVPAQSKLKEKV